MVEGNHLCQPLAGQITLPAAPIKQVSEFLHSFVWASA